MGETKTPPRDQERCCQHCGDSFVFAAGEQAFFAAKELEPPKRCPSCRQARRKERAEPASLDPHAGDPFDPGPGAWDPPPGRVRDRPSPPAQEDEGEGFPAQCDACGAATRLPFAPRTERPVYCPACFRNR